MYGAGGMEYRFSRQLKELSRRVNVDPAGLSKEAREVVTPLRKQAWGQELVEHPDRWFVNYILTGIEHGFQIGFGGRSEVLYCGTRNMVSAEEHPQVVDEYIATEMALPRLVSLVRIDTLGDQRADRVHCSPFGVIPKKGKPNWWRLIVNLSAPDGGSVNDFIARDQVSISYMSVDDMMAEVLKRGRGALLGKIDIKQAYRNIHVHPDDRHLLGMSWKGATYMDTALPVDHYIDDYITVGYAS